MLHIELPPTGSPAIDLLQQAQLIADTLPSIDQKINKMTETVEFVGQTLLRRPLLCSVHNFYGLHPDAEEMFLFPQEMMFMAEIRNFGYMTNPDVPIDSLVLAFEEPEFIAIQPEEADSFKRLSLRVPVLGVDTCAVID